MTLQKDAIVDIPPNRVKFFGTTGKMLLPCPATVAAMIRRVPPNKVITTTLLCKELTEEFEVEGTCPVTTRKSLQAVAHDHSSGVAYWRVVKQNGGLMSFYPGGLESHAALLQNEGIVINTDGKEPRVHSLKELLANFSA